MGTRMTTLPNGYRMELFEHTADVLVNEIWEHNRYTGLCQLQPGDVVIDVGANQGVFSLYAASRGACVYAVEPCAMNYELLCRNVSRNNLVGRVFPVQAAVAAHAGEITLYVPEETKSVLPSTFASTTRQWMRTLRDHQVRDVRRYNVRAVTLGDFCKTIRERRIACIKIDTEGAETEVLAGITTEEMERVEWLLLETHAVYPEKVLYRRVKELGCTVLLYEKIHGPFKTGFLVARKNGEDGSRGRTAPVAVLDAPVSAERSQEVLLDAGGSFSAVGGDGRLRYNFVTAGGESGFGARSMQKVRFHSPGPATVAVAVWDTGVSGDHNADVDERKIWIFDRITGISPDAESMERMNRKKMYTIRGRREFYIPSRSMPRDWVFRSLVLSLSVEVDEEVIPEYPVDYFKFHFNGNTKIIRRRYEEIYTEDFPNTCDFIFSLETDGERQCAIEWYVTKEAGPAPVKALPGIRRGAHAPLASGVKYVCQVQGRVRFRIERDMFPQDYQVRKICISFSVSEDDPLHDGLEGTLQVNGTEVPLHGSYVQNEIEVPAMDQNVECSICVPRDRIYLFSWWDC